ncbi:hypothetical protein LOTGIDRAFT_232762 [Lottia gigantea]|uniref:EF-hand domain-containing protein n=1 Tax=Lottia gigantea TaxID=225164 RepID=V4AIR7_LOTGI|nr:hypothetical protein LOTGIDRAFT_232762 [Lottia gigantea]ESO93361.1 hypothetical protein LOTGIDRAFT_232762 [Lottia gigantea]
MAISSLRNRPWSPMFRTPSVPTIPHPMSGREPCGDLSVRGVSTPVLRREKTISFVDKGQVDRVGEDRRYYMNDDSRLLHWPLDYQKPGYKYVNRQPTLLKGTPGTELVDKVRDKLTTGFYGVRHMFKANDPLGKGNITRDALYRVTCNLCGYVTKEQYERFLERIDLENHKFISFNEFVKCFQDNETVKRQWVIPAQKLETQELRRAMYPEDNLRNLDNMYLYPYHSAPYVAALLRDKLNTGQVNIRDIFPTACFAKEGMILAPQLREALAQLEVHLTNTEFEKLWSRFDRDNCGGVYTKEFYKIIGLTPIGQPKITTTTTTTSNSQRNTSRKKHNAEIVTSWTTEECNGLVQDVVRTSYNYETEDESSEEKQETKMKQEHTNDPKVKQRRQKLNNRKPPVPTSREKANVKITRQQKSTQQKEIKSENILNTLYSKYEEPYSVMLEAFQLFDYLDDGLISKIDFRRVLKEFGFPIAATELEVFLRSVGVRTVRGQIRYKDFLMKYQNRENNEILGDILANNNTIVQRSSSVKNNTNKIEKIEKIESAVVEHLHGDYLNLVNGFRQSDTSNEGRISEGSFRKVIENNLGGSLTDQQWRNLQKDLDITNGEVVYPRFLDKFQNEPRSWSSEQFGVSPKYLKQTTMKSKEEDDVIKRLRHMASYMMKVKDKDDTDEKTRRLHEIHRKIDEILRTKFHTFDKHFKDMDRKMTGRMTKWQFGALLRLTGLILEQPELDQLWGTMKLAPDGMLAYSALIQQFNCTGNRTAWGPAPPYATDDNNEMIDRARQIQRQRRDSRQKRPQSAPNFNRPQSAKSLPLQTDTSRLQKRKEIMKKIQPFVTKNWEKLQQNFVKLDKYGYSNIGYMEMRGIMVQLKFGLTNDEMKEILDQFDLHGNGRFHYISFLEAFYPNNTDFEFFQEATEISPNFVRKLLREWQNLRRAFRKIDSNNDGYLEVEDFKKCLKQCNIDGSEEDLYHLFSQFDSNLTGKICYKEFLQTLLSVK